jgi:hypothetical protein
MMIDSSTSCRKVCAIHEMIAGLLAYMTADACLDRVRQAD